MSQQTSYSNPANVAALRAEIANLLKQLPLDERAFETKAIQNIGITPDCEEAMLELAARRLRMIVNR